MSVEAITWALNHTYEVTPTQQAVLVLVCNYANPDAHAWPSQATIAAQARLGESTVRRALAGLEKAIPGFERQHRQRKDGTRTSDLIVLPLAASGRGSNRSERASQPLGASGPDPLVGTVSPTSSSSSPPSLRKEEPPPFKVSIPQGSPAHWEVIAEVARAKGAKLTPEGLAKIDKRYFDRDLTAEAHGFNDYWLTGMGENRPMRVAAQSWRNWLDRAPSKAARQRAYNGRGRAQADRVQGRVEELLREGREG